MIVGVNMIRNLSGIGLFVTLAVYVDVLSQFMCDFADGLWCVLCEVLVLYSRNI